MTFACRNADPAVTIPFVNTIQMTGSQSPTADVVALAATMTRDGIIEIDRISRTGAFAVATVNVGTGGAITVSADSGSAVLPITIALCQTNPATGACLGPPSSSVGTQIDGGATPTFGVFLTANADVPFDPGTNRIIVRFKDFADNVRGATSVAVRMR